MEINEHFKKVKQKLDEVSPTVCLAKWMQVTLHLQNGHNHSCHHPATHKIQLDEIAVDVSALHNTNFKKEQRALMVNGERPSECDYCWKVEDNTVGLNVYSDRVTKSAQPWAKDFANEILTNPLINIDPSYVEVSFSNICNLKCSYCGPAISSRWMDEVSKYGGYPTSSNFNDITDTIARDKMPIHDKEFNPYVEAFWKWWPTLYNKLHTFRITGGEPLLSDHTFSVLDYIIDNPRPTLALNINSNLCVPDALLDKFIKKMTCIQNNGNIKEIVVYTSAEAYGKRAEYIRHGLDYDKWYGNCKRILNEIPNSKLTIMATYNALSVTSFMPFLDDVIKLKNMYHTTSSRINLDVPYLRYPKHQTAFILTEDFHSQIKEQLLKLHDNAHLFKQHEVNSFARLYYMLRDEIHDDQALETNRKDFAIFFDEHDRRRGTNFLSTFPEMEEFYRICKK